jgi:hypothetical protein
LGLQRKQFSLRAWRGKVRSLFLHCLISTKQGTKYKKTDNKNSYLRFTRL